MAHHAHSNSFPSRLHSETFEDLHDGIERLLLMPLNQQALTREQQRKYVYEMLNGSIRLFDVCTAAKEALLQARNALKNFNQFCEEGEELKSHKSGAIIDVLQEAQVVTLSAMESLLLFVSGPETQSKMGRWSVVLKILHNKRIRCEEGEGHENEIGNAGATLLYIISGKTNIQIENAQNELQIAESCIQDLEEGLESINRRESPISHILNGLQDLHDCVDNFLQLPHPQETLAQQKNRKWVDELLDGSLQLLDLCSSAKDFVLQAKESSSAFQSVLCRTQGGEADIAAEVKKCLASRKAVKKAINKALAKLKTMRAECTFSPSDDNKTKAIVGMLKQVELVTLSVFESFLSLICGTKDLSKAKSRSLISKLMNPKRIACEEEKMNSSEFEKVDSALKMSKSENVSNMEMQSQLRDLESCIKDLEEGLYCLSRHLIKSRVSLLNTLNH
ncbi:hypothetical protein SLEP1_g59438 [Rubroshorea leprosula]|uniref:Uncharacterized protein n=1 Tax=Rubroshorea leprosula TaxID=152421 RepID=A0AAV5MTH1_9ROSI|nr:hypothetical protein SLEP1_g43107 [Rubroshorea leprosula]GKV52882.1 hypothetical protein SLEP1_g59438 [Rubroshorea leprosula]